jgi:AraC-like DNA-binding protein
MDARIQKILHLMEDDFSRGLPLGRMARSVNLSSSRLSHLFKSELGMSPAQYLKTLRMKKLRASREYISERERGRCSSWAGRWESLTDKQDCKKKTEEVEIAPVESAS